MGGGSKGQIPIQTHKQLPPNITVVQEKGTMEPIKMEVVEEEEEQDAEVIEEGRLACDEEEDQVLGETEAASVEPEGEAGRYEGIGRVEGEDKEHVAKEEELDEEERKVLMEEENVVMLERVSW